MQDLSLERPYQLMAAITWHKFMDFSINQLSKKIKDAMQDTKVWTKECPVSFEQLRILDIFHYEFDQNLKSGQIIVNEIIAIDTINIFKRLVDIKFPIYSVIPIHEFSGDDDLSLGKNNCSCFNFRKIEGSNLLSMHSYGLAIDINPLQNPFIKINDDKTVQILPKEGVNYLNRNNIRQGMVEPIVTIFEVNGINEWGGNWNTPIDYHHFQKPRSSVT